ncbi:MAG TPA: shikimate kinase [Novosphingobium sp.]|nr:shikimate kinase [Novosphingobium sp.]
MDLRQSSTAPHYSQAEIETLARRIDRPVVLVGMMGVGKSSVGKRLSAVLGVPFVDADEEIEKSAQMSIQEIFDHYGEEHFRDGERRVIARLIEEDAGHKVIATGGGAFCNPETRRLILDRTIAVWLDSDLDTLVERTSRKDNRPLLRDGDPREILGRLRESRAPFYSRAPIHVTSSNGPHSKTVFQVLKGIEQCL